MNTANYELKSSIEYANGSGTEIEGSFIELNAPTGKIAGLIGILKSEIGTATKNSMKGLDESLTNAIQQEQEESTPEESTPEEIGDSAFAMLTMGGANMERVFVTFKEILKSSAVLAGEKQMTIPMIDRMSYNDIEGCLKFYIGNFMKAS